MSVTPDSRTPDSGTPGPCTPDSRTLDPRTPGLRVEARLRRDPVVVVLAHRLAVAPAAGHPGLVVDARTGLPTRAYAADVAAHWRAHSCRADRFAAAERDAAAEAVASVVVDLARGIRAGDHHVTSTGPCSCLKAPCGARLIAQTDPRCPTHGVDAPPPAEFGHGAATCPALVAIEPDLSEPQAPTARIPDAAPGPRWGAVGCVGDGRVGGVGGCGARS